VVVTTETRVRKLMEKLSKGRTTEQASSRASMHRNTGATYRRLRKLPSELGQPRTWRTREDLFVADGAKMRRGRRMLQQRVRLG